MKMISRRRVRPSKIIGFVDGVNGPEIRGWVADENDFEDILDLEIMEDGHSLGTWRADEFRPDLLALGYGHGRHGFTVPLSEISSVSFSFSFDVRKPGRAKETFPLPSPPETNAQIARAVLLSRSMDRLPEAIRDICNKVQKAQLSLSSGEPTTDERLYFSDEFFVKALISYVKTE